MAEEPPRRHSTRIRRESAIKREADEPATPEKAAKALKTSPVTKSAVPTSSKSTAKGKAANVTKSTKATKSRKRQLTPEVDDSTPTPKVEILPSKLRDGEPMPTYTRLPKDDGAEYQTIMESGVIKAALARSRKRWITDGIFTKYWTKPEKGLSKKKREEQGLPPPPPKNPMAKIKPGDKIGTCKLVVEPHIFEITLYAIREYIPPVPPQSYQPYPPPTHSSPHPAHFDRTSSVSAFSISPPQHPPPPPAPSKPLKQPHHAVSTGGSQGTSRAKSTTTPSGTAGDPVIQMLAQRASVNSELKAVMKIVANGHASQQQLEYFQKHIDELHKIVDEQRRREEREKKQRQQAAAVAAWNNGVVAPQFPPSPLPATHGSHVPTYGHQPFHQSPRYAPPQQYKIKAVLIEFDGDQNNTRYLFPSNSILEYGPGFQTCTASFLIPMKVSDAEDKLRYLELASSGPVKEEDRGNALFWQPVTVQFRADRPDSQVLSQLGRAVRPANEVAAWMERVLDGEPDTSGSDVKSDNAQKKAGPPAAVDDRIGNKLAEEKRDTASKSAGGRRRAESRRLAIRLPKEEMIIELT